MSEIQIPPFVPHRLLRNGHAQTIAAMYLPAGPILNQTRRHEVALPDGDRLVLHEDSPAAWSPGQRVAVLVHGLAGCHGSPYMLRIARRLLEQSVRVYRLDLRGAGAGEFLSRRAYHGGCSDDLRAAVQHVARLCPDSAISLCGFSLGGNILLKMLGESSGEAPPCIKRAVACCPPVDLEACCQNMARGVNRMYDRHLVSILYRRMRQRRQRVADLEAGNLARRPGKLLLLDELLTAPVWGFRNAHDYYQQSSSAQYLHGIDVPTLIVAAQDDPLVPSALFNSLRLSPHIQLHMAEGGGHLGFIAARGADDDRRWLDWRIVDWITAQPHGPIDKNVSLDYQ